MADTPTSAPQSGRRLAKLNSPGILWPAAIALAIALFFCLDYFIAGMTHESTDDAFIAGHIVTVAPRVAGQIVAVHVNDNQMVNEGDSLAEIDPENYGIAVAQKESAAQSQAANYQTALAGYKLMETKVVTAEASAAKARADADASAATANRVKADFDRAQELRKQNTISQQEFDTAEAANVKAQADLASAQQNAVKEASKVEESKQELIAAAAEVGLALAQVHESQTNVASAQLDLTHTKIIAPVAGRITRKAIEQGNYVQVGQALLAIVPTNVWVVANFKESQLKKMQPGQRTTVEIDALGGRKFRAHVDSIQAGSGAQFSLLPPENATGNYVKVVQRVPVKIIFDEPLPADKTVGPGLSVVPKVQVAMNFPDWATALLAIALAFAAAFVFRFISKRKMNSAA